MTQHRDDQLVQILNQCCELLAAGESVSACLERFPAQAAELAPLLATVTGLRKLSPVPARAETVALEQRTRFMASAYEASRAVRNRPIGLLAALALWWRRTSSGLTGILRPRGLPRPMPVGLLAVLVTVILFGTLTTGAVTASAVAIPGDPLYPVKTIADRARILLARDPQARLALEGQIADEHLEEIRSVVKLLRRVDRMPLSGMIEEIKPDEWTVSGLHILIPQDADVEGIPLVGAGVSGTVQAPGDGTLVALFLSVEPVPAAAMVPDPTAAPTSLPPSTPPRPTAVRTATPTATREPTPTEVEPTPSPTELSDTATPTEAPAATRTPTRVPTKTATPTLRPTATWTPTPGEARPYPKKHIIDWVKRIEGSRWTIGEITTDTDGETEWIGDPGVGSLVEANLLVRPNGSYLALLIKELGGPTTTPEPYEFTGVVQSIGGDRWTIGGTVVRLDEKTQIEPGIQVGDWAEVDAERRSGGETWGKSITKAVLAEGYWWGWVESINGAVWTIDGRSFKVTGDTQIEGDPGVGDYVEVKALELPDGTTEAISISRVPDTATPTDIPTIETPTDTPAPPTETPTDTPAPPTETPTDTPEPPTETDTPAPPTPEPATSTPETPEPPPSDASTPEASPLPPDTPTPTS
jgi:hypothetical protein